MNTLELNSNAPSPVIPRLDPGLNPNQPIQRMNTPSAPSVKLCPGIAFDLPSLEYLPILGPSIVAPTKAHHPPIE